MEEKKQLKLNEFCKEVYEANKLKGFDVSKENIGQSLMLIVSELSEALEAYINHKHASNSNIRIFEREISFNTKNFEFGFKTLIKDSFEDEITDVAIRLFDLCGGLGIDLDWHIEQKRKYNSLRPHKHGKAY